MSRQAGRLRRLIQINEMRLKQQEYLVATKRAEFMSVDEDVNAGEAHLSSDEHFDAVSANFLKRAVRLVRERKRLEAELDAVLQDALEAKASSVSIRNRLEDELAKKAKAAADTALEEIAEGLQRRKKVSLPQGR